MIPRIASRLLGLLLVSASAASGMAGASSNGAGLTMESRMSAGGGPALAGSYAMVNIITGPASPTGTSGANGEAGPFHPDLYALLFPSAVFRWSEY